MSSLCVHTARKLSSAFSTCWPVFCLCVTETAVWLSCPLVQASLRSGCLSQRKAAAVAAGAVVVGSRLYSSDQPPEKISRYPIPYKKDLPYDIVELMEEVESKVKDSPMRQGRGQDFRNTEVMPPSPSQITNNHLVNNTNVSAWMKTGLKFGPKKENFMITISNKWYICC